MNKLSNAVRAQIVSCLVEGNSIRSTVRITGVSKNTVIKLLRELGQVCSEYQDQALRNLPCKRVECDEIWSFVQKKQKNLPELPEGKRHAFGIGDVWTFTAICPDTKIVPTWLVGSRDSGCAYEFMTDLSVRLANRVQMTTDGHKMYLGAVEGAFGADIDYSMLHKLYGADPEPDKRYSPAKCIGVTHQPIMGDPDPDHVSTSIVERQNLNMRMSIRRFTRLTNAFSKKVENLAHAVSLHFMYYNFARLHRSLRVTPAMEAGVSDHAWSVEEIAALLDKKEQEAIEAGAMKRGPYRKRDSN